MNFFEGVGGAALSGAGTGLAESQNKLMTAAREQREAPIRALNLQTAQEQSAMSHDAFVKWQKDQETVPTEELIKTNPLGADMLNIGQMSGTIEPGKEKYTRGEIKQVQKYVMDNPAFLQSALSNKVKDADDMSKKYDITLGNLNEKMKKLQEDPIANEQKIADLSGEIQQRQKEKSDIEAGKSKFMKMSDDLSRFEVMKQRSMMSKEDLRISDYIISKGGRGGTADVQKYLEAQKQETVSSEYHAYSQSMFGKNWNDLTQDQKSKVVKEVKDEKIRVATASGEGRMKGLGDIRTGDYFNLETKEAEPLTQNEFQESRKKTPGKYVTMADWNKWSPKAANMYDIKGAIKLVRGTMDSQKVTFSDAQRAQLLQASKSQDPGGAFMNLVNGEFGKSLSSEQQDYLINVKQLAEQSLSLRSILGLGQGSDLQRLAILATIPNERTFDKGYAKKQLDAFDKTLDRVSKQIPKNILKAVEEDRKNTSTNTNPAGSNPFDN